MARRLRRPRRDQGRHGREPRLFVVRRASIHKVVAGARIASRLGTFDVGLGSKRIGLIAATALIAQAASPARALDPARGLGQYTHTRWTSDNGAPTEVRVVTQTPDGFLWMGADDGLYRYDGVAFERVVLPNPKHGHGSGVNALLVTRAGALVVGFDLGGVGLYDKGRFSYLEHRRIRATVRALAEDRQGAIWVATGSSGTQLARYRNGAWRFVGRDEGLPSGIVTGLHVDRAGVLWLSMDHWLGYLPPAEGRIRTVATQVGLGPGLAEDGDGKLWISDSLGVRRFSDPRAGRIASGARFAIGTASRWNHVIFDRDQNLWGGGFGAGLFRVRALAAGKDVEADSKPTEAFPAKAGLTGDVAWSVFEDREGNIWVGTNGGLDRFRHANVIRQPRVGADSPDGYNVAATRGGAVLVSDRGVLLKAEPGQSLKPWLEDIDPGAVCESPDGTLWVIGARGEGRSGQIYRVKDGRRSELRPPSPVSRSSTCSVDDSGDFWVTAYDQPAQRFDGRGWRAYATEEAPGFSSVVATGAGRVVLVRGRRLFEADASGLKPLDYGADRFFPGNMVQVWRDHASTVVVSSNGLTRRDAGRLRFLSDDRFPWLEDVNGLARQTAGSTWIMAKGGVTRVGSLDLDRAFTDPGFTPATRTFTRLDGLVGSGTGALDRAVAVGGDGRVWLATTSGVFAIDANHLYRNLLPPPVSITALTVDGKTIKDPRDVVLAKGARSLQIDYAALSLTMPERVRFKYRLEGVDRGWIDPGARRQAFYTNLKPGRYRFLVKAANNDGVWNEDGAMLKVELPPTFLQSKLFLALSALLLLSLAWLGYRLRLRQVSERIRLRLQDRLAERERIARELHDTLLQGVQGLMLKFQAASRQVPMDLPARGQLETALDRAEDIMVEARERVRSLRSASGDNLAMTLAAVAERTDPDRSVETTVVTAGAERALHPVVADEIEKIVGEALFNAYRHADAKTVVVEIAYGARELSVRVRDDGVGIDQAVLDAGGRDGHYGLTGMQERAAKIQGTLAVRGRAGVGAMVELAVPSSVAYAAGRRAWRGFWRPGRSDGVEP